MNILLILLVIIAIPFIVALFVKKDYAITRDIIINTPKQIVFDHIKFLKNQDDFTTWATMDSNMKKTYTGTDGTPGFISAWDSENKKVGKGEQTIIKIMEGNSIESQLHFIKPFEGFADAKMSTESVDSNTTKVTWNMSSSMKYPMNLALLFMNMEKIIGDDFATGLSNLKNKMESK